VSTEVGMNRTGIKSSPIDARRMAEGARKLTNAPPGDARGLANMRRAYAEEGEPIGHVPPPATAKGALKTMLKALKGERVQAYMDKLGERIAFERTGTRLYDVLLSKWDSYDTWKGGPGRADLEQIRDEELRHFHLVKSAMERLGGDPTAVTPSANVAALASEGIVKVLSDPRTNLRESLDAILIAELTDNAGWELLIEMSRAMGLDEFAEQFEEALENEERHAASVRAWITAALSKETGTRVRARPGRPAIGRKATQVRAPASGASPRVKAIPKNGGRQASR
jgi:rubrerythrin